MEHERHLTCRPFHLDATHGRLWRGRGSLPNRSKGPFRACSTLGRIDIGSLMVLRFFMADQGGSDDKSIRIATGARAHN
jgi:hypothetical protein